ncbi:MAG: hypothetical protein JWM57_3600 [Phycisphaerales bacterium]|nr:hypothetical protein [Phycisphaerales bacterium]
MRILIFEPDYGGHRLNYVQHMALAFKGLPVEVVVALGSNAPGTSEYAAHVTDLGDQVLWDTSMEPLPSRTLDYAVQSAARLRGAIARHRPDRLYVPYTDGVGQVLGLRRSMGLPTVPRNVVTEGLSLRGTFCYPQSNKKQALKARLLWEAAKRARWDVFHLLDPVVYEYVARHDPRLMRRIRLMPDPVENTPVIDRIAARRELGIPEDGRYIGVVGLIDLRKGCDLLIRAFAAAPLNPTDRLLLAGRQDVEIRDLLAEEPYAGLVKSGRIQCINRMIPTEQMSTAIGASDMMATFYPRHIGSASIAICAAAGHRPVLAGNYGWLGLIVPRFQLGWTTDVLDAAGLPKVLAQTLDKAGGYVSSALTQRYVSYNSLDNFKAHWTAALRDTLGVPQSPDLQTWQSISESQA